MSTHEPYETWTDEQLQQYLLAWSMMRAEGKRVHIVIRHAYGNLLPEQEYRRYSLEYQGTSIFLTQTQYGHINTFIEQGQQQDETVMVEPAFHDEEDAILAHIKHVLSRHPSTSDGEATTYVLLKILDVLERLEKRTR